MKSHKAFSIALSVFLLCAITCTAFVFGSQSGIFSTGDMPFANSPAHGLSVVNASDDNSVDTDVPNADKANPDSDISQNKGTALASITKNPIEALTEQSPVAAADGGNNQADSTGLKALSLINPNAKGLPHSIGYTVEDTYAVEYERIGFTYNYYYERLFVVTDFEDEATIILGGNSWLSSVQYRYNASVSDTSYTAGRKYVISNQYTEYDGKRYTITDLKIYKKADGVKTEETVDVIKNDNGTFTFTMPECDIKIEATYKDNLHATFPYQNMTGMGAITVVPCEGSKMYYPYESSSSVDSVTLSEAQEYISGYIYAIENEKLNFTVATKSNSKLKSIGVYGWYNNDWHLQKDEDGNILNPKIEGCLEENADGTYTLTIPSENSFVYAEYEENNTDNLHATFPYQNMKDMGTITVVPCEGSKMYWPYDTSLSVDSVTLSESQEYISGYIYAFENDKLKFTVTPKEGVSKLKSIGVYGWLNGNWRLQKDSSGNILNPKIENCLEENADGTYTLTIPSENSFVYAEYENADTVHSVEYTRAGIPSDTDSNTYFSNIFHIKDADGEKTLCYNDEWKSEWPISYKSYSGDPWAWTAGRTYNISNDYTGFEKKGYILTDVEIYEKDIEGNVTDKKVPVTKNADGTFTFVMPNADIKVTPIYKCNIYSVCLQIPNDDKYTGIATLKPNDGCYLYRSKTDSYTGDSNPYIRSQLTSSDLRGFIYNDTATLTVTPEDSVAAGVGSVKAYKCYEGKNEIKTDDNGTILNEEIEGVLNDNKDGTYTVTHPESDYIIYIDYSNNLQNVEYECAGISNCYFDKLFTVTDSENKKSIRYGNTWYSELYTPYKNMKNTETAWTAGSTYTVAHKLEGYNKKHFEFTDLTIYKKDENGELTGDTVDVTKSEDGFSYTFVMPDCDVKVVPTYRNLMQQFNIYQDAYHMGSLTLQPDDGGTIFIGDASSNPGTASTITVNESQVNASRYYNISENDKMKLTVDTRTSDRNGISVSRVKSVEAYAYYQNGGGINKNSDGTINNEKISDVITKNEDGTYTVQSVEKP